MLLVCLCVFTLTIQNVFKKQYNEKTNNGAFTFSGLITFFALLFFIVTCKDFSFDPGIIPYSLGFAVCYSLTTIALTIALGCGSLAITSLISSYSLVIPTLHGLLFLNEKATLFTYIGLIILMISLYLVRNEKNERGDRKKISFKWLVCIILSFISNGMCSVFQKLQQVAFNGSCKNEFMILSLAIGTVAIFAISLFVDRKHYKEIFKFGLIPAALCGVSNGVTNMLVMVLTATIASSIFFPVLSAGQIILTFVISVLFYKEKFLKRQLLGVLFGIFALIFLNI